MANEASAPIVLAKDIVIALIEHGKLERPDAAEMAGKAYGIILDAIMESANKPTPKK
jgi:hypothetical protein